MNEEQRDRYSRHISLSQIGEAGQQKLLDSTALLIGAGGLGSPIAMYLAAAGVGKLIIADFDVVERSNLQRQVAHSSEDIGKLKSHSAQQTCLRLNPGVLEGSDNFPTRFAVNRACVRHGVPLVSGAAIRFDGQVSVYAGHLADAPCYRCLYNEGTEAAETCAMTGVLSPIVGIIGTVQAAEAIKTLAGFGQNLSGRLLLLDGLAMEWREIKLRKNPKCPVCGEFHAEQKSSA